MLRYENRTPEKWSRTFSIRMFNIPQPFSIRTRTLTQVIRIGHGHLLHTVRPDTADAETIFSNFVKYLGSLKVQMEELTFAGDFHPNTIPLHNGNTIRVVIHEHCNMGRNHAAGKLIYLPDSLQELMKVWEEKFGKAATRVLTADGAEMDDVRTPRDGDHLFLS